MKINNISRRNFLKNTAKFGLGASFLSPFFNLKALANPSFLVPEIADDYKVLVCFFQSGGNDSFNMLMPLGSEYDLYSETRSNLAIPKVEILPINATNTGNRKFGLHPSMEEIQALFEKNKIAFISNIGTLIQPTDAQQAYDETVPLPLGLFSHVDQQQEWMTGTPHKRDIKGWGGKIADSFQDINPQNSISMNISLGGTNIFQTGDKTIEFSIGIEEYDYGISGYGDENWDGFGQMLTSGLDSLIEHKYNDPFKQTYVDIIRNSRDGLEIFRDALENTDDLNTPFSQNDLSGAFKTVAKIIKANSSLGFKRQIYFIEYGGWDHHDELLDSQNAMLREVDAAFGEFYGAMEELNMEDNVTVFSMSEFGRTLTSNGNGTDHAWGGNVMAMGGAVRGKQIYGDYPTLNLDNERMLWDGVLVPTLSTDEYFTEIAQWFGVKPALIPQLFPNINNFYNLNSGQPPIGFLSI